MNNEKSTLDVVHNWRDANDQNDKSIENRKCIARARLTVEAQKKKKSMNRVEAVTYEHVGRSLSRSLSIWVALGRQRTFYTFTLAYILQCLHLFAHTEVLCVCALALSLFVLKMGQWNNEEKTNTKINKLSASESIWHLPKLPWIPFIIKYRGKRFGTAGMRFAEWFAIE